MTPTRSTLDTLDVPLPGGRVLRSDTLDTVVVIALSLAQHVGPKPRKS
jgi:hypothetical protein